MVGCLTSLECVGLQVEARTRFGCCQELFCLDILNICRRATTNHQNLAYYYYYYYYYY